jgi:LacI family transcriptional regulator
MKNEAKNQKTRIVGFWMDVDTGFKLELETYAGCQRYAREAGWRLVLDPSIKRLKPSKTEFVPYDGILARATIPIAEAAQDAGVPLVNLWLNSPVLESVPSVVADYEAAGLMAAEHLLGRGLRNFGFLGSRNLKDAELQFLGFRERVGEAGFSCGAFRYPHAILDGDAAQWKRFETGLEKWIDSWRLPIGVFVYQDIFCRFLIDSCLAKGLSVPGDVAIVGASDDTIICESSFPTLTSINFGYERRGYQAAAMLDRLMNGELECGWPERVPPARLIARESSDLFASSDPLVAQALRFIAERSNQKILVPEVSAHVGVSRRSLERRFQAEMGRGIAEEMIRLRLNRAKRRLVDGKAPLKTVAADAGFRNTSHFSRIFTQALGVTPSEFRAEWKRKSQSG